MSITDELREWASIEVPYKYGHQLTAIADRIDAEHERRSNEQYACGAEDGISASIEALVIQTHGFIELPKDADGKHIQPSDIPHLTKVKDGKRVAYPSLELRQDGTWMFAGWTLDRYRITKPTVEDVLREFTERVCDGLHTPEAVDTQVIIAEYAAKFRLAGDDA